MPDRPFDPHWITEKPRLSAFLDALCNRLTDSETRRRKRDERSQVNFETAIKAIVLDLYRADESDPLLEVGIPKGRTALQKRSDSRYGSIVFKPRSFESAMKCLLAQKYIKETTPFWNDPLKKNSRTARYQATSGLLMGLRESGASVAALRRHKALEGIRLKDESKNLVEYGNVPFAGAARGNLEIINGMLEGHWSDLALSEKQLSTELEHIAGRREDEAAQPFDFAARTVYRVFNNHDWEQGGRFYGAWWISCPSKLRRHILINGKRTVEVDYSGLHAAMLFTELGLPIPEDPYEDCLTNAGNVAERKLVKRTFNALLNADGVDNLNEIEGYSEELTGKCWRDFKKYIVSCYPDFDQYFGSGIGVRLQRMDSDLAEEIMLKFAAQGYACLPVHDSFIVHHALQDELTSTMQAAFEAKFGAAGEVGYDLGFGEITVITGEAVDMDPDELFSRASYETRLQEFRQANE